MNGAVFAISLAVSFITVLLSGLLAADLQNWFGVSDLTFLVMWFVPVGLIAAGLAAHLVKRALRWSIGVRYLVGLGLGLLLGFCWTLCVALLLGPWWGAVSLPALMCWMAGAVSGVVGGLVLGPGSSARARLATIVVLVTVAVVAAVSSKPLDTQLSHDQTLSVLFLKWMPGSEPLTIETERDEALTDAAVALVRLAKTRGQVRVMWGGSRHGRGPAATVLILLQRPISRPVSLRQPDRSMAVYVQNDQGFVMYPADGKTLDREITLSPYDGGVWCSVRIANGGVQSGPVRIW